MQFLAPLIWMASIAVAIPIILHLTRKASKKPLLFSSLMFLRRIPVVEVRRRKLKHPLLLLLRCLGILLLVAAFARPVLEGLWNPALVAGENKSVVVLLDSSQSMAVPSVWEKALEAASERVSALQIGDEVMVVEFGSKGRPITPWERNPARILQVLSSDLVPTFESTDYSEALKKAAEVLDSASNESREIFLITDLQRVGLPGRGFSDLELDDDIAIELKNVGVPSNNIFIEEVRIQREAYEERYPFSTVVRIASSIDVDGPSTSRGDGEVRLYLDDQLIDRKPFRIAEGGTGTVTFDTFDLPSNRVRGRIVLEPADAFAADDLYYFVVEQRKPTEILLVSGGDDIYFKKALSAGTNLPFALREAASLSATGLSDYPLLVLSDLNSFPAATLRGYVEEGGGLVITLGNRVDQSAFDRFLEGWLPVRIGEKRFARGSGSSFYSVTEVDRLHPVFEPFLHSRTNALAEVQFYGYWQLEASPGSLVLARFTNGDPALVEVSAGKGRVLVFASSMDRIWSDFPLRPNFLPFWQSLIRYASQTTTRPASMNVSEILAFDEWAKSEQVETERRWDILDPKGRRLLGLGDVAPDFLTVTEPGFYELRKDRTTDWIAVNMDRAESDLGQISEAEFQSVLSRIGHETTEVSGSEERGVQDTGNEVWWLLLILAGIVLLAEAVMANVISSGAVARHA
ncbi:MAG: VWA domain-containing protein [Acidobacteriota bacterium]|nr:MAG: VWA domain-containing protein [Acidobacteriota bacterium]